MHAYPSASPLAVRQIHDAIAWIGRMIGTKMQTFAYIDLLMFVFSVSNVCENVTLTRL